MMSITPFFVLIVLAASGDALKWKQCGGEEYVLIKNLGISPMPMKFPGASHFTLDAKVRHVLNGSDSSITIRRSTFLGYIKIPCLFEVGSCTYKDTCTLPQRMISENWGGIMGSIVSQMMKHFGTVGAKLEGCPLPVQDINVDKVLLQLPTIPSYMTLLASGDYQVQMLNKDKKDGKTILCIEMDFSIA